MQPSSRSASAIRCNVHNKNLPFLQLLVKGFVPCQSSYYSSEQVLLTYPNSQDHHCWISFIHLSPDVDIASLSWHIVFPGTCKHKGYTLFNHYLVAYAQYEWHRIHWRLHHNYAIVMRNKLLWIRSFIIIILF